MKNLINNYLRKHQLKGPILLGLSGGVDSNVLLHLLIESQKKHPFELHIAHVDHGLRKESEKECQKLKEYALSLGLSFYSRKISINLTKNVEDQCRNERLRFFLDLHQTYQFEGVFLAHHADDLIETVLKRTFEGSNIFRLFGLKSKVYLEGLAFYRPFLELPKKKLVDWANKHQLFYFEDSTNSDGSNLRSRLRTDLIPTIEKKFGKNIRKNLCKLSKRSNDLHQYFQKKIQKTWEEKTTGPFGDFFDCRFLMGPEITFLISEYAAEKKLSLSSEMVETLKEWIELGGANKKIGLENLTIHVDRGILFFQFVPISFKKTSIKIRPCPVQSCKLSSWKDLWKGKVELIVPKDTYELVFPNSKMFSHYSTCQVPVFLRAISPVLEGSLNHQIDLISGKNKFHQMGDQKISILF